MTPKTSLKLSFSSPERGGAGAAAKKKAKQVHDSDSFLIVSLFNSNDVTSYLTCYALRRSAEPTRSPSPLRSQTPRAPTLPCRTRLRPPPPSSAPPLIMTLPATAVRGAATASPPPRRGKRHRLSPLRSMFLTRYACSYANARQARSRLSYTKSPARSGAGRTKALPR